MSICIITHICKKTNLIYLPIYRDPVDDRDDLTITCDSENEVLSCSFRHTDPISEYEDGEINSDTIKCTGSKNENGETCQDDTRIKFRITQNSCGIDITDTTALDTGKWVISALTETSNGGHSVSYVNCIVYLRILGLFCEIIT